MTIPSIFRPLGRPMVAVVMVAMVAAAGVLSPSAACADDYVTRANAFYGNVRQAKRSDLVILPVVAKMAEPPNWAWSASDARLLPTTARAWAEVEAWAMAPEQRAVLEALAQVTEDEGPTTHMLFAQPYGAEAVSVDMVLAELYTELGDPPSLAAADFLYLRGLSKLQSLAHVEANRLLAAGEGAEALEVMLQLLFFGRQIADREMLPEKMWGMQAMGGAMEHLRDLAYRDFESQSRSLTVAVLTDVVERLDDRNGALGIERLRVPRADQIAVEQLLYQIYDDRTRRPREERYSATMARIAAQDRPLRLFSEAARWDMIRPLAAGLLEIKDALRNVANDYAHRWGLAYRDSFLTTATDYERTVRNNQGMAPIRLRYQGYQDLFEVRQRLRAEAAGTRVSLAMYAYVLHHKQFPRSLSAVRPQFVREVDKDPYTTNQDVSYFVPIRDQPRGPRGETQPHHEVKLFLEGRQNFSVRLRDDQFVIYSVGPDEERGWARAVTQASSEYREGDYLFWPPATSLLRKHYEQVGVYR